MAATLALPTDVRAMRAAADALLVLAALGALALALLWIARLPAFTLRAIRIDGDVARNSVSTIRANAAPQLHGNFFTMDLGAAQRAFESVPWVRRAVVRRVWPDRLAVRLEEHRPAALWNDERLVNAHGEVFIANPGDVEDDALPLLDGPEGSAARMLAMLRRLEPLLARIDGRIETLALSGRGSWRVGLDSGAEIELGRGADDEVLARTERFVATVVPVMAHYRRPLLYADLRHADGYALRLKGIATTIGQPARPGRG